MAKKQRKRKVSDDVFSDIQSAATDILGPTTDKLTPEHFLTTGVTLMDLMLSNGGGLPGGKVIEIYGMEGTGKSAIAMQIAKQAQMRGGVCHWIDSEQSFDKSLAEDIIGLDLNNGFHHYDVYLAEKCFSAIETMAMRAIDAESPVVIVLDSVANLCPDGMSLAKEDIDGGSQKVASLARALSWFFKRGMIQNLRGTQVYLVFLNQVRALIGGYGHGQPTETTPGGNALKFLASIRVALGTVKIDRSEKEMKLGRSANMGVYLKANTVKNRFVSPYRSCLIPLYFRRGQGLVGLDDAMANILYLMSRKVAKVGGGGYISIGDAKVQGSYKMRDLIREDDTFGQYVRDLVAETYFWEYGETADKPTYNKE